MLRTIARRVVASPVFLLTLAVALIFLVPQRVTSVSGAQVAAGSKEKCEADGGIWMPAKQGWRCYFYLKGKVGIYGAGRRASLPYPSSAKECGKFDGMFVRRRCWLALEFNAQQTEPASTSARPGVGDDPAAKCKEEGGVWLEKEGYGGFCFKKLKADVNTLSPIDVKGRQKRP